MKKWYHVLFVAVCGLVLVVLLNAPEVTTPRLPADDTHADRKDYPRCPECHLGDVPGAMPEDHLTAAGGLASNHIKCYFCHKPQED